MDCQGNLISSGATYTGATPITVTGTVIGVNTASSSQNGALSSTDWTTFNGKGPVYTATAPVVVAGSVISANTATTSALGVVKVTNGNGLSLAGDGTIAKGTLQSYATGSGGISLSGNTISGAGVGNAAAYGFVAGLSANVTGQNNTTPATVVFNTTAGVNGISNAQYNTSTGVFTPNLAGYYSVKANINVTNNAASAYMYTASIMRNSTIMYTTNITTASNNGGIYDLILFGTVSMNGTTDTLSIKVNVNNAAHTYTINNDVSTSFEAFGYYANLTSAATSSANGYLTSTDWTTFNNKVSSNTTYDSLILNTDTALKTTTINGSTIDVGSNSQNTTLNLGTSGSTSTINIGTGAGTTAINLGGSGDTVSIAGTLTTVNTTNLDVADKLVRLNKGGAASSATSCGIEFEENSAAAGYVQTSGDRNSLLIKAPGTAGIVTITPGASGFTINTGSGGGGGFGSTLCSVVSNSIVSSSVGWCKWVLSDSGTWSGSAVVTNSPTTLSSGEIVVVAGATYQINMFGDWNAAGTPSPSFPYYGLAVTQSGTTPSGTGNSSMTSYVTNTLASMMYNDNNGPYNPARAALNSTIVVPSGVTRLNLWAYNVHTSNRNMSASIIRIA
jgi:hypothetical protein